MIFMLIIFMNGWINCERSEAESPKAASLREGAHSETHILETESIRNFFNIDFFEKSE